MSSDPLPRPQIPDRSRRGAALALAAGAVRAAVVGAPAVLGAVGAVGARRSFAAQHEHWPQRPLTLVVPWPAGGPTDVTMRVLARVAGRELGQNVVVENRPGAAGAIGVSTMLAAAHDGYTIMQLPITIYRLPYQQRVAWDPARDVIPVLQISEVTFGIVVTQDSPFRSFADLLAYAHDRPNRLTVGSTGIASTPHLVMADLFSREEALFIHVPFKGAADQLLALQSKTIMVGVVGSGYAPMVDDGRLRLLATFNRERSPRWPSAPTLRELGYDIVATSPYGIGAPRGTPPEVIARLHDAFRVATFDADHVAELRRYDQQVAYLDTAAFARLLEETIQLERRWSRFLPPPRS
jgi:tripartite-type tricarboxylate transporter receptor subunit TctC